MKNQRFFNRQICAYAQIRGLSEAWGISMFGLNLYKAEQGDEQVDIYYSEMTPAIKQIVTIVKSEKPVIYGIYEEEKILVDLEEIYYIDTVDRRTFAYEKDKVYQIMKTLTALEEELSAFGFVRINKSNLVNVYMIKRIKPEVNMRISAVFQFTAYAAFYLHSHSGIVSAPFIR